MQTAIETMQNTASGNLTSDFSRSCMNENPDRYAKNSAAKYSKELTLEPLEATTAQRTVAIPIINKTADVSRLSRSVERFPLSASMAMLEIAKPMKNVPK